jgi:GxxExxY protein
MFLTGEEEKRSLFAETLTHPVIGAAIAVHETLGPGFGESCYAKALSIELTRRSLAHALEYPVSIRYHDEVIGEGRLDLLIEHCLVVELKTVDSLVPLHSAQVISYLKMTNLPLGLLMNFNVPVLKQGIKRLTHPQLYRKSG